MAVEEIKPEVWVSWLAQRFLASVVTKESKVFEWGSGGSTLWFAEHAGSVVSVEHSQYWGKRLTEELAKAEVNNCRLFICADLGEYVDQVFGGKYDLIMVDGPSRTRHGCADAASTQLRPGGWLVVDNTERPFAEPIRRMLRQWDNITFCGNGPKHEAGQYKITTTFWQKPLES